MSSPPSQAPCVDTSATGPSGLSRAHRWNIPGGAMRAASAPVSGRDCASPVWAVRQYARVRWRSSWRWRLGATLLAQPLVSHLHHSGTAEEHPRPTQSATTLGDGKARQLLQVDTPVRQWRGPTQLPCAPWTAPHGESELVKHSGLPGGCFSWSLYHEHQMCVTRMCAGKAWCLGHSRHTPVEVTART